MLTTFKESYKARKGKPQGESSKDITAEEPGYMLRSPHTFCPLKFWRFPGQQGKESGGDRNHTQWRRSHRLPFSTRCLFTHLFSKWLNFWEGRSWGNEELRREIKRDTPCWGRQHLHQHLELGWTCSAEIAFCPRPSVNLWKFHYF